MHQFEEGWVYRKPAWHRLADIKDYRPTTWEDARRGYLNWEPETSELASISPDGTYQPIAGYQAIHRNDTNELLSVQKTSYAVISNTEFGGLIEYAMGVDLPNMPKLQFDTLCVLKGGRIVVATLYLDKPIPVPGDPSGIYPYMAFWSNHDGLGGMRGGATAIRVVCSNTQQMAESQMEKHGFVFTIRHTKNWAEKVEQARDSIVSAIGNIQTFTEMASSLASRSVAEDNVEDFLNKWLPFSTAMTSLQRSNMQDRRDAFWRAYKSATCEGITGTPWGVLQAAIEAADHEFTAHSDETRTARILVHGDSWKSRALYLAKRM